MIDIELPFIGIDRLDNIISIDYAIDYKAKPQLITKLKQKGMKIELSDQTDNTSSQKQATQKKHETKREEQKNLRKKGCLLYMISGVLIAFIYIAINILKVLHG